MRTMFQRTTLLVCAGLLLAAPSLGQQKSRQRQQEPDPPPIELSEITMTYAVQNPAGELVWQTPTPEEPNTIPSGTQKLRFTAKVNNRPAGTSIRIKVTLHEVCSPDAGKKFLSKLRPLSETDEAQTIQQDGRVSVEILVHCTDCGRAVCGRECPDRDHLGEGPHRTIISPGGPGGRPGRSRAQSSAQAKPPSYVIDIMSVCPREEKKTAAK